MPPFVGTPGLSQLKMMEMTSGNEVTSHLHKK